MHASDWRGFSAIVAGVLFGNVVGVLPGMGVMATMSVLLPLTFVMKPRVPARAVVVRWCGGPAAEWASW
jgi:TctA family transporter